MNRRLSIAMVLASTMLGVPAHGQAPRPGTEKHDEDVLKAGPEDPFTEAEPKAMAALGVVAYGPFAWADGLRTTDVERVLGEGRILWLETAHFRIGCNLKTAGQPEDPQARRDLAAELKQLGKRWPKVPDQANKLEPWLRLHLYAARAEQLYAEVQQLTGYAAEPAGSHLGNKDKFLLALFQRRSDLARYHDRFCGSKSETSQCHFHQRSGQHSVALVAEADEPRDEAAVHAQFRFLVVQCLLSGLHGSQGSLPVWVARGLAHFYERQVTTRWIQIAPRADEHVDPQQQHEWRRKMRARAQRPELLLPFGRLAIASDLGYYGSLQAWSRVDFLMARDRAKFGKLLAELKSTPSSARQHELLEQVCGLDGETFDAEWRKWVLATYK